MAVPKLKRVRVPGLTKLNDALEQWASEIERALADRGSWPVIVEPTPTGNLVKIDRSGFLPRIMCVTSDITAATGTTSLTVGSGGARQAKYDPSSNVISDDTASPSEVVKNFHNKKFVAGCFIKVLPVWGDPYAFDINDCAKFT